MGWEMFFHMGCLVYGRAYQGAVHVWCGGSILLGFLLAEFSWRLSRTVWCSEREGKNDHARPFWSLTAGVL